MIEIKERLKEKITDEMQSGTGIVLLSHKQIMGCIDEIFEKYHKGKKVR